MASTRTWITVCFLLVVQWLQSQDLSYRQYTLRDGLPGTSIYHCLQDRKGFIWFATNKGVSRFDGRSFRNFTQQDGLPDNEIFKLYIDKYNNIWFLSMAGITAVYSGGAITKLDCEGVIAVVEDKVTDSIFLFAKYTRDNAHNYGYYAAVNGPGKWQWNKRFRKVVDMVETFDLPVLRASTLDTRFYFEVKDYKRSVAMVKDRQRVTSFRFNNNPMKHFVAFTPMAFTTSLPGQKAILFHNIHELYYADINGGRQLFSLAEIGVNVNKYAELNHLFVENDSTLWLCTRNRGLIKVSHFMRQDRTFQYFFPNSFCTSFLKDAEGAIGLPPRTRAFFTCPILAFLLYRVVLPLPRKMCVVSRRSGRKNWPLVFRTGL